MPRLERPGPILLLLVERLWAERRPRSAYGIPASNEQRQRITRRPATNTCARIYLPGLPSVLEGQGRDSTGSLGRKTVLVTAVRRGKQSSGHARRDHPHGLHLVYGCGEAFPKSLTSPELRGGLGPQSGKNYVIYCGHLFFAGNYPQGDQYSTEKPMPT
ncbi:hypothetical protein LZ30DRAFT_431463 [Colletotrichum cereale]|nr:hypothetical protein LZ30DRAFT_431463 [Colletotrichum cereale]